MQCVGYVNWCELFYLVPGFFIYFFFSTAQIQPLSFQLIQLLSSVSKSSRICQQMLMTTLEKYPGPSLFCGGNVRCDIMYKYTFKTFSTLKAPGGKIKQTKKNSSKCWNQSVFHIPIVQSCSLFSVKEKKNHNCWKEIIKKVKNPVGDWLYFTYFSWTLPLTAHLMPSAYQGIGKRALNNHQYVASVFLGSVFSQCSLWSLVCREQCWISW